MKLCQSLKELDILLLLGMSDIEDIISSKLKGIPPIYYLNLDRRIDKREYMENQFKKYNIKNYTRFSADRYSPEDYNTWSKEACHKFKKCNTISRISLLVNQIQCVVDWYYSEISETCLIVEDDLNFVLAKFWPFDWEYLMSRLPCNWDCVQFHIIGEKFIHMGLTKRTKNNHAATCYMITRSYVKKLMEIYYIDGKFKFHQNYGYIGDWPLHHYQSADFIPYEIGVTYSCPIFISNTGFISDCLNYQYKTNDKINLMAKKSDYYVTKWWKNESSKYSLDDFFLLDSLKKSQMKFDISYSLTESGAAWGYSHSGEF